MEKRGTPSGVRLWVAGARPRTWPAGVIPVVVGAALIWEVRSRGGVRAWTWRPVDGRIPNWLGVGAALVVALAIQIGTNYANDVADGVRGTDEVRVGPIRLVAAGLASPKAVRVAALVAFGVAGLAGLGIAIGRSWVVIPVGAVCFLAGWGYTGGPKPYGYLGLGEVFVFVFFGLVATVGTVWIQTVTTARGAVILAAMAVGLLSVALLEANNLRDIATDAPAGKRTLAVRLGRRRGGILYVAVLVGFVVSDLLVGERRPFALMALLSAPLAIRPIRLALSPTEGRGLLPLLQSTARLQLVAGTLLAVGLCL